jgi:hypothetical protein
MLKNLGIELEDEKIEELIRSASHAGTKPRRASALSKI